jgi:Putative peptidoglycan binding domain
VRRRAAPVALGLGVLAAAAVAVAALSGGGENRDARATAGGGSTAAVERRTLVQRETVDGTLGYAGSRTLINRLGSGSGGDGNSPSDANTPAAYSPSDEDSTGADTPTATAALFAADADSPDQDSPDQDSPDDDSSDEDNPNHDTPNKDNPKKDTPDNADQDDSDQDDSDQDDADQDDSDQDDSDKDQPSDQQDDGSARDSSTPDSSNPDSSDPDSSDDSYSGSGTVTALPRAGTVIERGEALYRLDGDPIALMYGSTPAYRALKSGIPDGRDVRELEQNLGALGFDPGTVDDSFTSTTATAVSNWQESVGLEQTGSVELGRVVFMPGARRIGEHKTSVGSVLSSGSEVLATSSTERVVSVALDASLQDMAREGERVEVTLPDGAIVGGHISTVGRVAREEESSSSDPNAEPQLVIDLTIELRSKHGIGRLDEAPVSVGLAQETRRHVLAVPVTALVARRGGGYGLELAGSHRIVPIRAGLFADGYVEVAGAAVREGTRVMVPRE